MTNIIYKTSLSPTPSRVFKNFEHMRVPFQRILRVDIMKRRAGTYDFQQVELRIGNTDKTGAGLVQFTDNTFVAKSPGPSNERDYSYHVPLLSGRYLVLQCVKANAFSIDEVWVFTEAL